MVDLIRERQLERERASFPVRELTYFLDGSQEETNKAEAIMNTFERDPLFKIDEYSLTLQEKRELTFKRITRFLPFTHTDDYPTLLRRLQTMGIFDASTLTRFGVHYGLFLQTVKALGTDQQNNHWAVVKGGKNLEKFYGCFGMTELEHGSNVAKLQTEAIFDKETDGFYLNTPFLGATKWWIGGAAHSATHCVVYARLKVDGKDYGIKNFVVQLRNLESGELLPGVAVGDIGKKMGRDGVDNGWIQFSRCWIPRFNMLSRFTQVDANGKVTLPKFEQLGYTALVNGRVSMVGDSFHVGKKFITIALRYASVRRQFGKDENGLEKKIIDYPHHRRRLFPLLATVFAFNSSAMEVLSFSEKCQKLVDAGDIKEAIPNLKDLFALSGGLKAFATWEVCKIIDESRQACGGHGYSAYNEFGRGYDDWVVQCTWEGDNNVLSLSCGRALIQNYLSIEKKDTKLGVYSQYLQTANEEFSLSIEQLNDVDALIQAWETVSKKFVKLGATKFKTSLAQTNNLELSFEQVSSNRFEIAKLHTKLTILKTFYNRVKTSNPSIKPVLTSLALLYVLHITSENIASFYSSGIIQGSSFNDALNDKIDEVNDKLRPDIIGLTDSFNLSDFFIGAKIGNHDGNLYENYFKYVSSQKDGGYKAPYFDTVLKPFLHRDVSLNDNERK